ncbi:hypothetical protein NQZ68_008823 [Dissostichus eleginoides]|nr:hypothetical protein NQZ68_008823 [Dissostichus eleginoides]
MLPPADPAGELQTSRQQQRPADSSTDQQTAAAEEPPLLSLAIKACHPSMPRGLQPQPSGVN